MKATMMSARAALILFLLSFLVVFAQPAPKQSSHGIVVANLDRSA